MKLQSHGHRGIFVPWRATRMQHHRDPITRCLPWIASIVLAVAAPSQAAFHLWALDEIYTNSTGTLQFIEMHDAFANENFVGGMTISVTNTAHTQTNTFTIPSNL